MFRFAIGKGWVTGDIYQKELGLAAQQCWSQQVLPRATSKVNLVFAEEFMFYGAQVAVSPEVSPHCIPLNTDRTGIAHSWSFLVKKEQVEFNTQGFPPSCTAAQQICGIHCWQWASERWGCLCVWCHTPHTKHCFAAPPQDTSVWQKHSFLGVLLILTTHTNYYGIIATVWHWM